MEPPPDAVTAYHEAGHAVLALALGRPVQRVSIRPGRDHLGRCALRQGPFRPSADHLERELLTALGGTAAGARHTGRDDWAGAAGDWQHVRRMTIERAGPRQAERLERRLLSKAEHLLAQE